MNLANIETFLCIARSLTLSDAADALFVSQSTVSTRIRQLEEELNATLLLRKKGVRTVELTPQGLAFIPLAERWLALNREAEHFAAQRFVTPFCVACPDSLNTYLFQPLYRSLASPEQGLSLRIRTHQSPEIFDLIDRHEADAGFAFHLFRSGNVVCKPLFSEQMVLLCSSNGTRPDRPIAPEELAPEHERFLSWSQDFQWWHDSHWDPSQPPFIWVDSAPLLASYMDDPNAWALCPMSIANALIAQNVPVRVHRLTHEPPRRMCYYLTNRTPKNSAVLARFRALLYQHLTALQPLIHVETGLSELP